MSKRLLALDGDWLAHRAFYAFGGSRAEGADLDRIVSMSVTKCIHWCLTLVVKHQASHLIFALDGGKSFRKDVYPPYKSNRGVYLYQGSPVVGDDLRKLLLTGIEMRREPSGVDLVIDQLAERMQSWNVFVMRVPRYEADDVLASTATLAKRFSNAGASVHAILGTADKDTIQSLNAHAEQTYPHHVKGQPDIVVRFGELGTRLAKYVHPDASDWTPNQFLDFQILIGDSTDSVPEILKPAAARKLLCKHGSLFAYFKTSEGSAFFDAHRRALHRNVQLVRMNRDLMREWTEEDLAETRVRIKPPSSDHVTRMLTRAWDDYAASRNAVRSRALLC